MNADDRRRLAQLQRRLEQEDPEWVRRFTDLSPARRARERRAVVVGVVAVMALLTALAAALGRPEVAVALGGATLMFGFTGQHL